MGKKEEGEGEGGKENIGRGFIPPPTPLYGLFHALRLLSWKQ